MRRVSVPRQLIAAVLSGALLAGCSAAALETAAIPSGAQLSDYYANDFYPSTRIGGSPRQVMTVGVSYVDQRCAEFFDAVEQTSRKMEVAKSGFFTASNQTLSLMKIAKKSTLAIAEVAAAVEITKVLLDEYQEQFAFAPHSVELRALVFDALYKERVDLDKKYNGTSGWSEVDAVADVKRYADNCTLGRIREHWNAAIAKAVQNGVTNVAAPAPKGGKRKELVGDSYGGYYSSGSVGRYGVR